MDFLSKWNEFQTCTKPLHWQLLATYLLIVVFRVSHRQGQRHSATGKDFLLSLRHENPVAHILMLLTWRFTLPMFVLCTGTGTVWLFSIFQDTPSCLPPGTSPWFLIFMQILSYFWIAIHVRLGMVACVRERRIRVAECEVRQLEGATDIRTRWGEIDHSPDDKAQRLQSRGLSAAEINALPSSTHRRMHGGCYDCAICLNDLQDGDSVRTLSGCRHVFHRACIDLWVLRRAECPLCKCEVKRSTIR